MYREQVCIENMQKEKIFELENVDWSWSFLNNCFEVAASQQVANNANLIWSFSASPDHFDPYKKHTALVQGHCDVLIPAKLYPVFSTYVGQWGCSLVQVQLQSDI